MIGQPGRLDWRDTTAICKRPVAHARASSLLFYRWTLATVLRPLVKRGAQRMRFSTLVPCPTACFLPLQRCGACTSGHCPAGVPLSKSLAQLRACRVRVALGARRLLPPPPPPPTRLARAATRQRPLEACGRPFQAPGWSPTVRTAALVRLATAAGATSAPTPCDCSAAPLCSSPRATPPRAAPRAGFAPRASRV